DIIECSNINKPDLSKYNKIEDDIRTKNNEIANAKARRSMLHDEHRKLQASIYEYDADNSCDECGSLLDTPERRQIHSDQQASLDQRLIATVVAINDCETIIAKEKSICDLY